MRNRNQKVYTMKFFVIVSALLFLIVGEGIAGPPVEEGKLLFTSRCANCHNVKKTLVGPALGGVDERRSMEWIIKFVRSSQSFIKSGDKDAIAVFQAFNNIPMPDHPDLTEQNIRDIVSYIKTESVPDENASAPFDRPGKLRPAYVPVSPNNYLFFSGLFLGIIMLVGSLLLLVRVKEMQRQHGRV